MRQIKVTNRTTDRDNNGMGRYMMELTQCKPLSPEEESEVAFKVKQGDRKAKETLIKANLRFVISIAKNYTNFGLDIEDLISEGNIGLVRAVDRYDPTTGFKFISYAVWWIRQSILQAIANKGRIVDLPGNQTMWLNRLYKIQLKFEQENERPATVEELEDITHYSKDLIRIAMIADKKHLSLETPVNDEDCMIDLLQADSTTDASLLKEDLTHRVLITIDNVLKKREAEILKRAYGIGTPSETYNAIAEDTGLCRERVRQIVEAAIRKIRNNIKEI